MLSGPILVSVMTATLSRGMTLNRREELLMRTFDHDHLMADLQAAAARILQMWWRAKCRGVFWPPPLSERLYEGMVIDMLEAKRLLQRHLWAHGARPTVTLRRASGRPLRPARPPYTYTLEPKYRCLVSGGLPGL